MAEQGGERVERTLEYWLALQAGVKRQRDALATIPLSELDDIEREARRRRLGWDAWNISKHVSAARYPIDPTDVT